MKKHINYKLIILVMVPFLIGRIVNVLLSYGISLHSTALLNFSSFLISLWKYGAVIFWFWVGRQFGSLQMGKIKSIILGNIAWGGSFGLYIWQFFLVDDTNRNFFIAGISQEYMLGFVSWSSKIINLFTNTIKGTTATVVAYLLMFLVFTIGFITSSKYKT